MNPKREIERHRLPCGPMSISVDGVCRRKLRDHFDTLLDRLTQETHPEGVDRDLLEMEEEPEIPEEKEPEETRDEKKSRMLDEGKLKLEVKKELEKHEKRMFPEKFQSKGEDKEEKEPTREERKKKLIQEGKLSNEVKKEVQKHADRIMPKSKTSDHAEPDKEDKEQGNSKLLHRIDGKMTRWQGRG